MAALSDHSFVWKLDRAREHIRAFQQEAGAWIETNPYDVVEEPDPEPPLQQLTNSPGHRRIRVGRIDAVLTRLALIIGDCLFNARAALDHLALSLATSFTPNMSSKQIMGS